MFDLEGRGEAIDTPGPVYGHLNEIGWVRLPPHLAQLRKPSGATSDIRPVTGISVTAISVPCTTF